MTTTGLRKANFGAANLPALTGLRGMAALWVVAFHICPNLGRIFCISIDLPGIRDGYLGVDVFFILSGFILCHVYSDAFRHYTVREHLHFLLIRLARVYPLHAFVLVALALVVVSLPGFAARYEHPYPFFTASGFVVSALLLQNWARHQLIWNGPAWSLSAEWAAYVAFPLPLLIARGIRESRRALFLAALSLSLLALTLLLSGRGLDSTGKAGFLRLAGEFLAGCLIHRVYQLGLPSTFPWSFANLLALLSFGALLFFRPALPLVLLPLGFLILSIVHYTGLLNRFLSSKIVVLLGDLSYSIYLTHWILIQIVGWYVSRSPLPNAAAGWGLTILLVTSIFVVSGMTWRYVERPARAFGRRIANIVTAALPLPGTSSDGTNPSAAQVSGGVTPLKSGSHHAGDTKIGIG